MGVIGQSAVTLPIRKTRNRPRQRQENLRLASAPNAHCLDSGMSLDEAFSPIDAVVRANAAKSRLDSRDVRQRGNGSPRRKYEYGGLNTATTTRRRFTVAHSEANLPRSAEAPVLTPRRTKESYRTLPAPDATFRRNPLLAELLGGCWRLEHRSPPHGETRAHENMASNPFRLCHETTTHRQTSIKIGPGSLAELIMEV
jgi:hypothetical protein